MPPLLLLAAGWAFASPATPLSGADVPPPERVGELEGEAWAWTPDARGLVREAAGAVDRLGVAGVLEAALPCAAATPRDVAVSPDGASVAVLDAEGAACVGAPGGASVRVRGRYVRAALPDAGTLVLARPDGALEARSGTDGARRWKRAAPVGSVAQLRVVPRASSRDTGDPLYSGRELLLAGERGVAVVDAVTGRLLRAAFVGDAVAVAADAQQLWAGLRDGRVIVLDRATWRPVRTIPAGGALLDLDVSLDVTGAPRLLLLRVAGTPERLRVLDLALDAFVFEEALAPTRAGRARFAPGEVDRLFANVPGRTILWRRPDGTALPRPISLAEPARHRPLRALAGEMLGTRPLAPEELPAPAPAWSAPVAGVAPTGSGAAAPAREPGLRAVAAPGRRGRVASGRDDGTVRLQLGAKDRSWQLFGGPVSALAWDAAGARIAAAGARGPAREDGGSVTFLAAEERALEDLPAAFGTEAPAEALALGDGITLARWREALVAHDATGALRASAPAGAVDARLTGEGAVELLDVRGARLTLPLAPGPLAWTPPARAAERDAEGRWAVTVEGDALTPWDARTGRRVGPTLGVGARVRAVSFSPDGAHVAVVRADAAIDVLEARSGALGSPLAGPPASLPAWAAFSPDGSVLWTLDAAGAARGTDLATGALVAEVPGVVAPGAPAPRIVEGGRFAGFLAPGGGERWIDLARETPRRAWEGLRPLAVAADGAQLAWAAGGRVYVDDRAPVGRAERGRALPVPAEGALPEAAAFHPDGKLLAVAWSDGRLRVVSLQHMERRATLEAEAGTEPLRAQALAFSENGTEILARTQGRAGPEVRRFLWAVDRERMAVPLGPGAITRGSPVNAMIAQATRAEGPRAWTAHADGGVRGWDLRTGAQVALLSGHVGAVRALAIDTAKGQLVSVGEDGTLRTWDLATGVGRWARSVFSCAPSSDPLLRCGPGGGLVDVAVAEGALLARGADGLARAWAPEDGKLLGRWALPEGAGADWARTLPFTLREDSPAPIPEGALGSIAQVGGARAQVHAGDRVLSAHADGTLRLWRASDGAWLAASLPLSDGGWILDASDVPRRSSPSLRDGSDAPLYTR